MPDIEDLPVLASIFWDLPEQVHVCVAPPVASFRVALAPNPIHWKSVTDQPSSTPPLIEYEEIYPVEQLGDYRLGYGPVSHALVAWPKR